MSSSNTTIDAILAPTADWRELASRNIDGLAVSLFWNEATNLVKVTVADSRLDDQFEFDIAGAEALAAFYHPFAYAAGRSLCFGDALSESTPLQLQS